MDLKKLGITPNFPATKLKAGNGDAVCKVLLDLTALALQKTKFKFKKPTVPEDDGEDDGGQGEDDMDGGADLADL
jgi:estrogen-related receptor beta like 1